MNRPPPVREARAMGGGRDLVILAMTDDKQPPRLITKRNASAWRAVENMRERAAAGHVSRDSDRDQYRDLRTFDTTLRR